MANIRKSFNFRTGLQVDNDNFVVNENGLVGIGTSIPQNYLLNVHGDTRVTGLTTTGRLYAGIGTVGVLSATNANVSGVVTVGQLKVGSSEVVDNLIGYARTTFITDNGGVGLHTTSKIGVNTTTSPGASDVEFKVHGNANVTGILTATTFDGSGASLTSIPNSATTATNANTASAIVARDASGNFIAGTITANLTGNADTASNLTGYPNITVTSVGTTDVNASGIITATTELNVGTGGTAITALDSGRLGIGTAIPSSDLQIRKASGSLLEVISTAGVSTVSIGQSVGIGKSTGVLRFGNSANDFDIINNDKEGDINFILSGLGQTAEGKFSWQDGETFTEVMSLHPNGNFSVLGITTLASGGGITTTGGALYVGGNLEVDGSITGTFTIQDPITSNVNVTSGISTFNDVKVDSKLLVSIGSSIGIRTDNPVQDIDAQSSTALFGSVGIGTTDLYGSVIGAYGNVVINGGLGINTDYFDPLGATLQIHAPLTDFINSAVKVNTTVGFDTTDPRAIFDFGNVGSATTRPMMVVPNITDAVRDTVGYAVTPTGSIIFNITSSKFQGYDGTNWVDFH